jgi:hypothetical protein
MRMSRGKCLVGAAWIFVGCSTDGMSFQESVADDVAAVDAYELGTRCGTLMANLAGGERYLDAYTIANGDVVTRPRQLNDTQRWCFTRMDAGGAGGGAASGGFGGWGGFPAAPRYTVQHRSFSGQFLDAYETVGGKSVLRDAQNNLTQQWEVEADLGGSLRLRQRSSGLYLKGLEEAASDYRVVMGAFSPTYFDIVLEP